MVATCGYGYDSGTSLLFDCLNALFFICCRFSSPFNMDSVIPVISSFIYILFFSSHFACVAARLALVKCLFAIVPHNRLHNWILFRRVCSSNIMSYHRRLATGDDQCWGDIPMEWSKYRSACAQRQCAIRTNNNNKNWLPPLANIRACAKRSEYTRVYAQLRPQ